MIIACPPLKSNVNLSRMVRLAGCCAIDRFIVCGQAKVDPKIARDGAETVRIESRNSLPPILKKLSHEGYRIVGLEQTNLSQDLHTYQFTRKTVLVLGSERNGITQDVLDCLDDTIEIPVWGLPYSYNIATATTMAVYEYCRQFPRG